MTEIIPSDGSIADYYKGQNILITGATGFVGKALVEKLLRSCPDIDTIYLLIREKKNERIHERMDKLFTDAAFERLNKSQVAKVVPIAGDITLPGLGLSPESRKLITEKVSTIFHSAAIVSFNDCLRKTLISNLRGTYDIIQLCKEVQNLRALCYVSTAYSHSYRSDIDEVVYPCSVSPEKILRLVETMSDDQLELIAPKLIGSWPNYYSFSKGVAENMVQQECHGFPTAIYRPSIVVGSYKEPVPGWIDNVNGPTGMVVGGAMGIIRVLQGDLSKRVDLIPVDFVVNGMIAATWEVGSNHQKQLKIFNGTSGARNPFTWGEMLNTLIEVGLPAPPSKCIWYYSLTCVSSYLWYRLAVFFLHFVPGAIMDFAALLLGKKRRMLKLYKRIDTHMTLASFFASNEWNFRDKNIQATLKKMSDEDTKTFGFDVETFVWKDYFKAYFLGLRRYILKDDDSTIPKAVVRYRKLYYLHRCSQLVAFVMFIWLTTTIFSWVFLN